MIEMPIRYPYPYPSIAPPRIAPARGPPLWEAANAKQDAPPDPALQPAPAYEFDQRLSW